LKLGSRGWVWKGELNQYTQKKEGKKGQKHRQRTAVSGEGACCGSHETRRPLDDYTNITYRRYRHLGVGGMDE